MNSGISKKVIFSTFLFINFIQPGKCADLHKFNNRDANIALQTGSSKILNNNKSSYLSFNNNFEKILPKKNFLEKNSVLILAALSEKQEELVIQSDKQSEINDVIYAEGNVSVSYKGKLLKADNLTYNKLNKKISAEGNISFILGDQLFKVAYLEYSFISEKGYLLDVEGSINTNRLMDDLSSNFS